MRSLITLCMISMLIGTAASTHAQLADTPWPSYGGDARNTHLSPYVGPDTVPTIKWTYSTGGTAVYQPIISPDGAIIFTTNSDGTIPRDEMFALERDGMLRWGTTVSELGNWASVDTDGRVYIGYSISGSTSAGFRAYNQSDGSILFSTTLNSGATVQSGTVIGDDGSIYLTYQPGVLRSYTPGGGLQWETAGGGYNIAPALDNDGNIIVGGSFVDSYSSNGQLNWSYLPPDQPTNGLFFSVSVAEDGTVYAGRTAGSEKLFALDNTGSLLWSFAGAGGSTAIGPDGTIYAGHQTTLYAINPDGTEKWHFNHGPRGDLSVSSEAVTIDANGNVYVTNAQGFLFSLDPEGQLRWTYDLAPMTSSNVYPSMPVIDADGTLYIGSGYGHTMFALIPEPTSAALIAVGGLAMLRRQ